MKKFIFCISLVLTGLMTACVDKNEAVDADSKPSWLGESIYQELKSPTQLTGTFNYYLRLVDDLGETETLNHTGSKTVFPANDEAFGRFFQSNPWGVNSYSQLTTAQKKMLLYNSMLDNALLVSMFSNVMSGSESVTRGLAMKHQTSLSVIDSIQHITSDAQIPQNNKYWDKYREDANMYLVSDATPSYMIHFTREHMLNNGITTLGNNSDFAILTGTPYQDGMAYIFDDQIVRSDITCQNGYIHQMKDVIIPPGNMAQMLRADSETKYFSRMLDYFSAPYENTSITDTYNAWARANNKPTIDMVYEMRYFNSDSHHRQDTDPNKLYTIPGQLVYDPGWNQYSPKVLDDGIDYTISDVGSIFAPIDDAVEEFFTEGGEGAYLIDLYCPHKGSNNNAANLVENIDTLFSVRPDIICDIVNSHMFASFSENVPSKFATILSDASEYKGIELGLVKDRADGRKDIKMANNGVIYKMTTLYSPDKYQSVWAPAIFYPDMGVMNWAVEDDEQLGVSHHYYLMAMKANYAFFIPDDSAFFSKYYVDPVYLGHDEPRVLKFSYDGSRSKAERVRAVAYKYNPVTGEVGDIINNGAIVDRSQWKSLMVDILNYHTVVLNDGETLGSKNFYKTKHGGTVRVTGGTVGSQVMSGQQIDNGVPASNITEVYREKNGAAYRIDNVIQAPRNSVSKTLQNYSQFSDFYDLCAGFSAAPDLLEWAGISSEKNEFGISEQDSYIIFTSDNPNASTSQPTGNCLDENVKMFNTFNYTLYAPNNTAMQKAFAAGLPSWDDIIAIREEAEENDYTGGQLESVKQRAHDMIDMVRDFTRYHFQGVSVYADNVVEGGRYNSLSTDELGLAIPLNLTGGGGVLTVTDATGVAHAINASDTSMKSNLMARDYWFTSSRATAREIYTSSFCVVHEISEPLNSGRLGITWSAPRHAKGKQISKRK